MSQQSLFLQDHGGIYGYIDAEKYIHLAIKCQSPAIIRSAALDLLDAMAKRGRTEAIQIECYTLYYSIAATAVIDMEQMMQLARLFDILIQFRPVQEKDFHPRIMLSEYMNNRFNVFPEREGIHARWTPDASLDDESGNEQATTPDIRMMEEGHFLLFDPITSEGGKVLDGMHNSILTGTTYWAHGYLVGFKSDQEEYVNTLTANGLNLEI